MSEKNGGNCDDCHYYRMFRSGGRYCSYILDTGRKRPCPPGEGCTVKVGRAVNRKRRK